jgi:hypothetical protein
MERSTEVSFVIDVFSFRRERTRERLSKVHANGGQWDYNHSVPYGYEEKRVPNVSRIWQGSVLSNHVHQGGLTMDVFKGRESLALAATVVLSVLLLGACTSVRYSYDMKTNFSEPKRYAWAPPLVAQNAKDPLLEANVQVLADQLLAQKGFTRVSENPDLLISTSYEFDMGDNYHLQMLTLNIYRYIPVPSDMPETTMQNKNSVEKMDLVWRGTAFPLMSTIGSINTTTSSGDLRKAVQGILSKFPPK